MSEPGLRRTIRRSTALLVFSLMLLVFLFEHYLTTQGIGTDPVVHYLAVSLAIGAGLYLAWSVGGASLRSDE